jgi:hypothetical protein
VKEVRGGKAVAPQGDTLLATRERSRPTA